MARKAADSEHMRTLQLHISVANGLRLSVKPLVLFVLFISVTCNLVLYREYPSNSGSTVHEEVADGEIHQENVRRQATSGFDWTKLQPSESLEYVPCYQYRRLACAYLLLPLDYEDPSLGNIKLAVIKYSAPVPLDDPQHGGMLVTNPGGPGGSGIYFVRTGGDFLAMATSTNATKSHPGKYFDIVSFDPRGIGVTSPHPTCFKNQPTRHSYFVRYNEVGGLDSSNVAVSEFWSLVHAQGAVCNPEQGNMIKKYVSTTYVSRDMLSLVEKDAVWRKQELAKAESQRAKDAALGPLAEPTPPAPLKNAKLQYWGFSYGTLLGATFASLYPDRVGKVILDGVVEFNDYYDTRWTKNLHDTQKVVDLFYESCAAAGPKKCALARKDSTAHDVRRLAEAVIKSLRQEPLYSTEGPVPMIVTYSDIALVFFQSLYFPYTAFAQLAGLLAALAAGQPSRFAAYLDMQHTYDCRAIHKSTEMDLNTEAQAAVVCSDGAPIYNHSVADVQAHVEKLQSLCPIAAGFWAKIPAQCTGYKIRPKWRLDPSQYGSKTVNPILFVSNTMDPVTPRIDGVIQSSRFPGSRLLTQNGGGHCSVAAPSKCTSKRIKEYLFDGSLPKEGTVCQVDGQPFEVSAYDPLKRSTKESEYLEAHARFHDAFIGSGGPLGLNSLLTMKRLKLSRTT